MVNLDLYRVFYTVAKRGSLTKAAEELYISQPAVSQSIRQLENQLGVTLFNRTHRGMELSEQGGKVIFSKVEQALKLFTDAENKIQQLSATATGTIRIAATTNIFAYFLVEKLAYFRSKYPEVKIELITALAPSLNSLIKENKCDVAFVLLPIENDPDLVVYGDVMRVSDIFTTNKDRLELTQGVIPLAKLQEYPLILSDEKTTARKMLNEFLARVGIDLKASIEIGDVSLMKQLVTNGMGIGVMPREYARRRLKEGLLYEIQTDPPLPVRSVGLALAKNAKISYALKMFLELFDLDV